MMIFYNIVSTLAALAIIPLFALYSLVTGKKRRGLAHRFGLVPSIDVRGQMNRPVLWVHALSRGEVSAAAPVLRRIRDDCPKILITVSVATDSGFDAARELLPFADQIMFHPLDCWPFIALAVNRIKPSLFAVTDTGFWPGLPHFLRGRKIPTILFNGRISGKSIRRYKMFGSAAAPMFQNFSQLCMQNQQSRDAVINLGVDPSRVQVSGDSKLDALPSLSGEERLRLRKNLCIPEGVLVWTAGSSHQGEEIILLEAFQKLTIKFPSLVLILAPRRMERIGEVEDLLKERNLPYALRSQISEGESRNASVILLDTMGELADIYSIAAASFVGRSLIAPGGGHSLIEPVAQGIAVLHGPYIENVSAAADELGKTGLAITVKNAEEIETAISQLLENESLRNELARKAMAFVEEKKGASQQIANLIREYL